MQLSEADFWWLGRNLEKTRQAADRPVEEPTI